jgi:hypothetical protein
MLHPGDTTGAVQIDQLKGRDEEFLVRYCFSCFQRMKQIIKLVYLTLSKYLPTTFIHCILRKVSDAFRTLKGASSVRMLIITLTSLVLVQINSASSELS